MQTAHDVWNWRYFETIGGISWGVLKQAYQDLRKAQGIRELMKLDIGMSLVGVVMLIAPALPDIEICTVTGIAFWILTDYGRHFYRDVRS